MKKVGLTQRVDCIPHYHEKRDALDQRWSQLLTGIDILPIPLANIDSKYVSTLFKSLQLDAIILTGGNSLCYLEPQAIDAAPERDEFELKLIEYAIAYDIPIIGICRGMQKLNHFFYGDLYPISGHIAKDHKLISLSSEFIFPEVVNSYHGWAISNDKLGDNLVPLATDKDGNIEAFKHAKHKIFAIMWHPERGDVFDALNIQLLKRFLL